MRVYVVRKSELMLELEREHQQDIATLVAAAINEHGSIDRAGEALGVNRKTFHSWVSRLRIETRKIASVAS
jgi:hypothetical protein